jgi:hypothetical protein
VQRERAERRRERADVLGVDEPDARSGGIEEEVAILMLE